MLTSLLMFILTDPQSEHLAMGKHIQGLNPKSLALPSYLQDGDSSCPPHTKHLGGNSEIIRSFEDSETPVQHKAREMLI